MTANTKYYELLLFHRLNKNMVDGGSYITIGDMYKGNKIILPERWKGKGLSVSFIIYLPQIS